MKNRIAVWAGAGFVVAGCWALYFALANKESPLDPMVYTLACLTQPIALVGRRMPLSLQWVLLANTVTYALAGLILEMLRRRFSRSA